MNRLRLTNSQLFDGDQVHEHLDVLINAGEIDGVVAADAATDQDYDPIDCDGRLLAPGLVDLQVNGGGGVLFNTTPTQEGLAKIMEAHRALGTTAMLPTLITDSDQTVEQGIAAVAAAIEASAPGIAGIHLEGPYLNPLYKGVHDANRMCVPDAAAVRRLQSLASGRTLVTLAPETVSLDVIRQLCAAGVVVFGGHSAATYEETRAALGAGLSGFTHLFNAMSPLTSRAPGMVGAALDDANSFAGVIADGHHVHPATLRIALAAKASGKMLLVTDAMPTAGSDTDEFDLSGVAVRSVGGRCVTADGTLAGSDIGMIDAVRNAVTLAGVDLPEALRMASLYPAQAVRLDDRLGRVRAGYRADLIELDESLQVRRSWIGGQSNDYPQPAAT